MPITSYISSLTKPKCAPRFEGVYLEDAVPGYRTHSVTGRNDMSFDFSSTTIGTSDGATFSYSRKQPRSIEITFGYICEDIFQFRRAIDRIKSFFGNFKEGKIVFNDEPDLYYIGTLSSFRSSSESTTNASGLCVFTGSFGITLSDPFKYSTSEKVVSNAGVTEDIVLVNNGSDPVPISLETVVNSASGYLGFVLNGRYIQLGNPDTKDTDVSQNSSSALFTQEMYTLNGWTQNSGVIAPNGYTTKIAGTMAVKVLDGQKGYAYPSAYLSNTNCWHGPTLTRVIPTDSSGTKPLYWKLTYIFNFNNYNASDQKNHVGHQSFTVTDTAGKIMAAIMFEKNSKTTTTYDIKIYSDYCNNTGHFIKKQTSTGYGGSHTVVIERVGDSIRFTYPTTATTTATVSHKITGDGVNARANQITWFAAKWSDWEKMVNNDLRYVQFVRNYSPTAGENTMHFQTTDTVVIEEKLTNVTLNGSPVLELLDAGSQALFAPPGRSVLSVQRSSFSSIPNVTVKYREKWW